MYSSQHRRLADHVENCLSAHKCVSINGLGGFVCEVIPATFDHENGRTFPPVEEIHFNGGINHRDGLIERTYAACFGISLRRARIMLDDDVRAIKRDLLEKRCAGLGRIGLLYLSDEGVLGFTPDTSELRISLPAYGLRAVSMPKLAPDHVGNSALPSLEKDNNRFIHFRISKMALATAASVAIVLSLLVIPWMKTSSNIAYEAAFLPTETVANAFRKREISPQTKVEPQPPATPTAEQPASEETRRDENTIAGIPIYATAPNPGAFYVVIATFSTEQQVQDFIRQHPLNIPMGILKGKQAYRIYTAIFDQAGEAYTFVANHAEEAWVYTEKSRAKQL